MLIGSLLLHFSDKFDPGQQDCPSLLSRLWMLFCFLCYGNERSDMRYAFRRTASEAAMPSVSMRSPR